MKFYDKYGRLLTDSNTSVTTNIDVDTGGSGVSAQTDTSDPTSSDDSHDIGTLWVNTSTDTLFVCVDNTSANAVWKEVSYLQINDSGTGTDVAFSASKIIDLLSGKSDTGHSHTASDVTDFDTEVGNNTDVSANTSARHTQNSDTKLDDGNPNEVTASDLRTHLDDSDKHREINDSGSATTDLWSADKIDSELSGKADSSHNHAASDITSGQLGLARGGTSLDLSATAKGGILYLSAAGTLAVLPIGSDDDILKVNTDVPNWETDSGGASSGDDTLTWLFM